MILIGGMYSVSPRSCASGLTNVNPYSRIAAVAPFAGLRRFPQGRHFKQWTGDDSKALMKVRHVITLYYLHLIPTTGVPPSN